MSETQVFRCDDAAGFELRVFRADDGDFYLSVVPRCEDFEHPNELSRYDACHTASVRIRAPMIGGGSHDRLWHALAELFMPAGTKRVVPRSAR